jgi:hypothetical protein
MKQLIVILLVIILVVLVGTWPLTILAKVFEWIAYGLRWLATALNFFGWNGLI